MSQFPSPKSKRVDEGSRVSSVADPHEKNADVDPGKNLDADPDTDPDADSCP